MKMNIEHLWNDSEGKTEVLGGKHLSQCYLVYHKSRMDCTWIDPKYTNSKQQTKKKNTHTEKIK